MLISERRAVYFSPASGSGPREIVERLFLPRPVRNVVAGLSGYSVSFPDSSQGRPFGRLVVELFHSEFIGNEVALSFRFGLRDWSGTWDDTYEGLIDYVALVDLEDDGESSTAITIHELEYNQAIQFFRSDLDLDPPNQQPNNAVPLVAGKATAVRVYADFNPTDGVQEGDEYAGELEVESAPGNTILTELLGDLFPKRDTSAMPLTSGQVPHFVVPPEFCTGTITLRGRLRVNRPPGALETGWSPTFQTHLQFSQTRALPVFLVGFNYLGDPDNVLDQPAAAPTQEEAEAMFDMLLDMFPVPEVEFTGYQVIDIEGPGSSPVFEDRIFQALRDLKGDATDEFYYGLFGPDFDAEIPGSEGTALGGSAIREEGIAWSMPRGGLRTVAHEMGHLLGREHAPGVEDTPGIDPNFPHYGSYPWGSIGQHGVDTTDDLFPIESPVSTYDFMSYKDIVWISPYTYSALLAAAVPPGMIQGGGGPLMQGRPRRLVETLFLAVDIRRDRSVQRLPSFHYPAPPRLAPVGDTGFTVELVDECRDRLVCWPLGGEPVGRTCWPRRLVAQVPYPAGVKWLLVWEGDRLLYEECLPTPPSLDLRCQLTSAGLELDWSSSPTAGAWYLLQWRDPAGKWRGLGPRTQETHAFVPGGLLGPQGAVRVLATSGIATTMAVCEVAPPRRRRAYSLAVRPQGRRVSRSGQADIGSWRAMVHDETGRSVSGPDLLWFDHRGLLIHTGSRLPLDRLGPDARTVTLVVRNRLGRRGLLQRTWAVQRTGRQVRLVDPTPSPQYFGET